MRRSLLMVLPLALACAADVRPDASELQPSSGPRVEFDPARGIVPFPNDLLIDAASGRVALPPQCGETESAQVLREEGLNALDGFGVLDPELRITFNAPVDVDSLDGRILLVRMGRHGVPDAPSETTPVPVHLRVEETTVRGSSCAERQVTRVTAVPKAPLRGDARYAVAILDGITTPDGELIEPSPTWALVRQPHKPVEVVQTPDGTPLVVHNDTPLDPTDEAELAQLVGLDALWDRHRDALTFLDVALARLELDTASPSFARSNLLLAWSFPTQTVEPPLDVDAAQGPGHDIAAFAPDLPVVGPVYVTPTQIEGAFAAELGTGACAVLPCAAVGRIVGGQLESSSYQTLAPNPVGLADAVPGPWDNPLTPGRVRDEVIPLLGFVPAAVEPAEGYPVVLFGHGLTSNKEALFALGAQLAAAGYASVAIDWVAHGERAVQIRTGSGCGGIPDPTVTPRCFAPILSTDLLATRDSFRQSVLDLLKLARGVAACGASACSGLPVDRQRIGYVGQSLGALLGSVAVAQSPELRVAALNVGGVGWVDVLEQTASVSIRCPLVDALIDTGILPPKSQRWENGRNADALCLGEGWRQDPGYRAFAAAARWILDPADGAGFSARLADSGKPVLVQQVIGDSVVPAVATERQARLLSLLPVTAGVATSVPPEASLAVPGSAWLRYANALANPSSGFPGNSYAHASLLAPAGDGLDGQLGTAQMQADLITFLRLNL